MLPHAEAMRVHRYKTIQAHKTLTAVRLYNEHLCLFLCNIITFNSAPVCSAPQIKNGDLLLLEVLLNASRQMAWWVVSKRRTGTHTHLHDRKHSAGRIVLLISGISHRSKGSIKKWCCSEEAAGLICITTHVWCGRGRLTDGWTDRGTRQNGLAGVQ